MDATRRRNILVPGWILTFGLVAANAPPLGVVESLGLSVVGLFVVPALIIYGPMPFAPKREPAETTGE